MMPARSFVVLLFSVIFLKNVLADLRIEVMKEGLTDLKTTTLKQPNITRFTGSAIDPYIGGTSGELVLFTPYDACSSLKKSKYTEKDSNGHLRFDAINGMTEQVIVLVSSGGCSYEQKFKNAKEIVGVGGVLIYSGENEVFPPSSEIVLTGSGKDLPGYLISNSLGQELTRKVIKYRGDPMASNDNSTSSSSSNSNSIPYIEIMMTPQSTAAADRVNQIVQISLVTIIVVLSLAFTVSVIIHMRNIQMTQQSDEASNGGDDHLPAIDVEFLQKLPLKTFRHGNRRKKSEEGGGRTDKASNLSPRQNQSLNQSLSPDTGEGQSLSVGSNNLFTNKNKIQRSSSCAGIVSPTSGSPVDPNEKANEYFEMIEHEWPMNEACPICLEEFTFEEVLNELPCGHCYHIACIQPWLQYRSPNCPLCKLDVRRELKEVDKLTATEHGHSKESIPKTTPSLRSLFDRYVLKSSATSRNSDQMEQTSRQNLLSSQAISIEVPPQAIVNTSGTAFTNISLQ